MITTIEIIQEFTNTQQPTYRAICGDQQVGSPTPGQALDTLERMLAVHRPEQPESTLIVVQRFRSDAFFTAQQQTRLQEWTASTTSARAARTFQAKRNRNWSNW